VNSVTFLSYVLLVMSLLLVFQVHYNCMYAIVSDCLTFKLMTFNVYQNNQKRIRNRIFL